MNLSLIEIGKNEKKACLRGMKNKFNFRHANFELFVSSKGDV